MVKIKFSNAHRDFLFNVSSFEEYEQARQQSIIVESHTPKPRTLQCYVEHTNRCDTSWEIVPEGNVYFEIYDETQQSMRKQWQFVLDKHKELQTMTDIVNEEQPSQLQIFIHNPCENHMSQEKRDNVVQIKPLFKT